MGRPGRTKKPCAGCGGTQPWGRETGKLCSTCQRLLDDARQAREAAAQRARRGLETFPRPWAPHALGYIHRAGDARGAFQDAFYELLHLLLSEPASPDSWPGYGAVNDRIVAVGFRDHSDQTDTWSTHEAGCGLVDPALLEAAGAVYKAARQIAQTAFDAGKAEGSRLLFGLASGNVSIAALNSYEAERSATAATRGTDPGHGFEARCRRCRGYAVVEQGDDGHVVIACRACGATIGAQALVEDER